MRSRTVDDKETSIVSPVDAKIASLGTLTPKSEFQVKGQMYQLLDLLGDREKAQQYVNGHYGFRKGTCRVRRAASTPTGATIECFTDCFQG